MNNITCSISGLPFTLSGEFIAITSKTHNFHPAFSLSTSSILSHVRTSPSLSAKESLLVILYAMREVGMISQASYKEGSFNFESLKTSLLSPLNGEVTAYRLKGAVKVAVSLLESYNICSDKVRKFLSKELPVVILREHSVGELGKLLKVAASEIETANFILTNSYHQQNFLDSYKKKGLSSEVAAATAEDLLVSGKLKLTDYVNTYLDIADTFPEVFTSLGHNLEDQVDLIKAAFSSNLSYVKENILQLNELQTTLLSMSDRAGINSVAQRALILMIESSTKAVVTLLQKENKNNLISIDTLVYKGKGGVEVTMVSTSELTADDLVVSVETINPQVATSTPSKPPQFSMVAKPKSALELLREKLAARTNKEV